jgi:hypothetical protein
MTRENLAVVGSKRQTLCRLTREKSRYEPKGRDGTDLRRVLVISSLRMFPRDTYSSSHHGLCELQTLLLGDNNFGGWPVDNSGLDGAWLGTRFLGLCCNLCHLAGSFGFLGHCVLKRADRK